VKKFHKVSNYLPERIILYRDGVGDKQIIQISEQEITQIKEALKDIEVSDSKIGLMYINVCKRVNTRLFA
jgi:hypothetical protein